MICTQCNKENRDIARYCKWCGTPIVKQTDPLDMLVGMADVKSQFRNIVETFTHLRASSRTQNVWLNLNSIIIGETGTGKTSLPHVLRDYLSLHGIIAKPKLKVVFWRCHKQELSFI